MGLADYGESGTQSRVVNVFGDGFCAAIVHEYDFEIGCVRLPDQGLQAFL
jgi:hypothetical protein